MPVLCRSLSFLLTLCLAAPLALAGERERDPQIVVISFDGAHDVAQWKRSRALARATGARFTYFLSCVFLLSKETRATYTGPGKKPGQSNVGFAASRAEVAERLDQIGNARREGHEIASHGCGHFDGKSWSAAEWGKEFTQFRTILRDAYTINGIEGEPEGWRRFAETGISGFRAPYLSVNAGLAEALIADGLNYDASSVSRGPAAPRRKGDLWHFALPLIPEGPTGRRVIAMDYNWFVRHSDAVEQPDADGRFEERSYRALMNAFDAEYDGARTPLQIGFHFTLMNGGAYWRALERFAKTVCEKDEVRCIGYGDLVETLEAKTGEPVGG
ncbi:polysaccharide deacetylase [Nitratireductor sp. CAU 1489]|uniref:Polysaccharide deacetylase n=1 Tax=Nitratireductor arenosus TaxID=2682096 RepID=A0A844QL44_9HYPH|nr:polysaccharide deacetylase [Nitratireductor arenosus]MVA98733.1 polysaccharide deacetylase [Nitratireductor arenosus]